jgi:hypothetical protein
VSNQERKELRHYGPAIWLVVFSPDKASSTIRNFNLGEYLIPATVNDPLWHSLSHSVYPSLMKSIPKYLYFQLFGVTTAHDK